MPSASPRKHAGWFILLLVVLTLIVRSKRCLSFFSAMDLQPVGRQPQTMYKLVPRQNL